MGMCQFGYAGYYQIGNKMEHQFSASYSPMQQKDNFNAAYVAKPSKRLQMFTEFKGNEQSSEFLAGFRIKFMEGNITGYMTSGMKAYATYVKNVENFLKLEFNSNVNFLEKRPQAQCNFGLNLSVGMM
jgi:hypothetical protein